MRAVVRRPDGGLRVTLRAAETEVLASLPDQLRVLVGSDDVDAAVRTRLYPDAYEDPLDELEFRELVGSELVDGKLAALDLFAASLARGRLGSRGRVTLDLDGQDADAWLAVLNDARLILGVLLGVTEESDHERAAGDPQTALLQWLGWLQEQLLAALMTGLRPPI